ncbi:MAG: hypothetical protein JOZ74_15200, partial [Bradyrhizobium sp.]|nr:hypothetical protein [Bradyrhizobium sp.]
LEQASLTAETPARIAVPVPQQRPAKLQQQANQAEAKSRLRGDCHTFSCEWPRLSESINDLKKLFGGSSPTKGKKS